MTPCDITTLQKLFEHSYFIFLYFCFSHDCFHLSVAYQNSTTNSSACNCPEECNVNSYSPELSLSGLSLLGVQEFLLAGGDVTTHNTDAQEVADRVDSAVFSQTVQLLQALTESHFQIRSGRVIKIVIV